ncbi:MAG: hypothetical protein D6807_08625 [Alphaproteobacteria bacterium]|nr:MAG: hypothetical protein D6807_08625 [Alphaproteobacteria bacterium]
MSQLLLFSEQPANGASADRPYRVRLRVHRARRVAHWIEAEYRSREECDAAIERLRQVDPSIVAIERQEVVNA